MAANVPGIVWSALRALSLNEVARDSPIRRHVDGDKPYEPSLVDVAVVKAMLYRAKKLPPDLVDAILDMAEYWIHSTTQSRERISILGGKEERENRFLASICILLLTMSTCACMRVSARPWLTISFSFGHIRLGC